MIQDMDSFILTNFEKALEKRYIMPFYQPVIRTISRKLCSFEALARWMDPVEGMIRPDQFIPVLERARKIHLLDLCIIQQVCEGLRRAMDNNEMPVPVSVNLSRMDFQLCDIFAKVDALARQYQIPHEFLYIEITEGAMAQQEEQLRGIVDRFHMAGYQVWMDDFGSAYSSLNTLKDFSFDELKLDMHFLSSFSTRSRRILTAIVQMAKDIEMHTLAEGVETEEQYRYLRNIGCEKVQGYFFGRPLPYFDCMDHLEKTGIVVESPKERKYYDDIGLVNLLSAVPMMSRKERDAINSARQLNSIPLAMVEMTDTHFTMLFHNTAFEHNARSAGMLPELFAMDQLGVPQPLILLAQQVGRLLDAARDRGSGQMYFISNEEYYEIQAKCVAQLRDRYCVLLQLDNLSQSSRAEENGQLDQSLRHIYSLFERITLINVKADSILPLYMDTQTDLLSGRTGLKALTREYADKWIFYRDRQDYLAMMDIDTLEQRLADVAHSHVNACLRTLVGHGQYAWKQYTVLRLQEGDYLILVRNVHEAAMHFLENREQADRPPCLQESVPEKLVWRSLVDSGIIRLFWKDKDRRFLGASPAFLEYYDFQLSDILGKNDEDLGWHIHADAYKSDEYQVIHEGAVIKSMPGRCIRHGENRDILANKAPLYDDNGQIQGLVGYFIDRGLLNEHDSREGDIKRRDMMTGLLNAYGLQEEETSFRDEYYLRNKDFVRIHVTIDDFANLVNQHGFEFGDKAMVTLGRALKRELGKTSAVARYSGQRFVILRQILSLEEARQIRSRIKAIGSTIQQIDGVPLTLYLSVGYALYSQHDDLGEQKSRAEDSLLMDHDDNSNMDSFIRNAAEIFYLYDDLPIPFAVFKAVTNEEGVVTDCVLCYCNNIYTKNSGLPSEELLGHRSRELFPTMEEAFYDAAGRAAIGGETVQELFFFPPAKSYYHITVSPVIHTGYCAYTFLVLDTKGLAPKIDTDPQFTSEGQD